MSQTPLAASGQVDDPLAEGISTEESLSPVESMALWLDAGELVELDDGDPVVIWPDTSGNDNDGTAQGIPTYKTSIVNGQPVVRFNGTTDYFTLPNAFTGYSAGTLFIVIKIDNDPPGVQARSGFCKFGTGIQAHYPYTNGVIYDNFVTNSRKTTVNPVTSLALWNIYEVKSAAGEWTSWLNGGQLYTIASNTVAWTTAPLLGVSVGTPAIFLDGDIAELLVYGSALSDEDRLTTRQYLANKYGITI